LWVETSEKHYHEHADIFARLGVECTPLRDEQGPFVRCEWTENTARAYQLIHILMHELGHHYDRMTTASKQDSTRGEPYAEAYARRYEELVWHRFLKEFDLD